MGEVSTLPVDGSKAREHVTLSVERLSELLATAEEVGYRSALTDIGADDMTRNRLVTGFWSQYGVRCTFYSAIWRRARRG